MKWHQTVWHRRWQRPAKKNMLRNRGLRKSKSRPRESRACLAISILALATLFQILLSFYDVTSFTGDIDRGSKADAPISGSAVSGDGGTGSDAVAAQSWENPRIPTEAARDRYERFRHIPNATMVNRTTGERRPQPFVQHRGIAGLGHRLIRMSGLYHTLRIQQFQHLHASWGWECGGNEEGHPDIFDHLFGIGPVVVPLPYEPSAANADDSARSGTSSRQPPPSEYEGMFRIDAVADHHAQHRIVNEVPSYVYHSACAKREPALLFEKAISDEQLFRQLRTLFRFNDRVQAFTQEHSFAGRLVFGIHVRSGNGESGDFTSKKRGFHNLDSWIDHTARALSRLASKMTGASNRSLSKLPPLLFVATDETAVVDKLANATTPYGIVTVSFPQSRPDGGTGVSYNKRSEGAACHESWVAQFTDTMLLSVADVVIAGRYSSFTQAVPLFAVLADSITRRKERPPGFDPGDRATYKSASSSGTRSDTESDEKYSHRLFCESNVVGDELDCYDDYFEWLWTDKPDYVRRQKVGNRTLWMRYRKEVYDPCGTIKK